MLEKRFGKRAIWGDFKPQHEPNRTSAPDSESQRRGKCNEERSVPLCKESPNIEDMSFLELCASDPLSFWRQLYEQGMLKEVARFICFFASVQRFDEIIGVLSRLDDIVSENDLEAMVYCLGSNDILTQFSSCDLTGASSFTLKILRAALRDTSFIGKHSICCRKHVAEVFIEEFNRSWKFSDEGGMFDCQVGLVRGPVHNAHTEHDTSHEFYFSSKETTQNKNVDSVILRFTIQPCPSFDFSEKEWQDDIQSQIPDNNQETSLPDYVYHNHNIGIGRRSTIANGKRRRSSIGYGKCRRSYELASLLEKVIEECEDHPDVLVSIITVEKSREDKDTVVKSKPPIDLSSFHENRGDIQQSH